MNDKRLIPLVIALTVIPLIGLGCNPGKTAVESAIESQTGGKVNINEQGGTINFQGQKGETITVGSEESGSVAIPADFPTDMPVYAGAKVLAVYQSKAEGTANLSLTTSDAADKVTTWYEDQFKSWKQETTMDLGAGRVRVYSKDSVRIQLTISSDQETNKTTVMVTRVTEK